MALISVFIYLFWELREICQNYHDVHDFWFHSQHHHVAITNTTVWKILKNSHLASKPLLITSRPSRPPTVQSISPLCGVRTMPLTRLISPVTQLSVRKLIHCNNKETIKALHHWPFCCEPRVIGGFPVQRVNKVSKTVSLSLGKSRQLISGTN